MSETKIIKCPECDKGCRGQRGLTHHRRVAHEGKHSNLEGFLGKGRAAKKKSTRKAKKKTTDAERDEPGREREDEPKRGFLEGWF